MAFLVRRLARLVIVLVCVTFFSFFLLQLLPGDPVTTIAADRAAGGSSGRSSSRTSSTSRSTSSTGTGSASSRAAISATTTARRAKDPVSADVGNSWP